MKVLGLLKFDRKGRISSLGMRMEEVVPLHQGRDISPSLLRKIASDIHLTVEEFLSHR